MQLQRALAGEVVRRYARPSRRRLVVPLLAFGAVASIAGCDRLARGTAQGALDASVNRAIPAIERQSGLMFKQRPRVELRTPAEVRAFLERAFTESRAARELAGQERAYKLFGLVPDTLDVRALLLDVLEQQVAGFYDPKTKTLYVVKGSVPAEALKVTIAHELVHALQDQYVSLDSIQHADVDNDRATAAQAAIEGHATYISLLNVVGEEALARLPGGWAGVTTQVQTAALSAAELRAAPAAIREALIFPYTAGLTFVSRTYAARPGVGLLTDPPLSTEQVLHAAAYDSAARDQPTTVALTPPERGTRVYENTLGEFETRLFLAQHLRDTAAASAAATGWDGDRYMIVQMPEGQGIVWATTWDTPPAALRFRDALRRVAQRRFGSSGSSAGEGPEAAVEVDFFGQKPESASAGAGRRAAIHSVVRHDGKGPYVVWYEEIPAAGEWSGVERVGTTARAAATFR